MERRLFIKLASLFIVALAGTKVLSGCSQQTTEPSTDQSQTESPETASSEIDELVFGIISTESQANQKPIWEPFIEAMSEELGVTVKPFYVTQYAGVIEGMRAGNVDIAWFGGKSYIEAAERANADAFAQTVNSDGTQGYYAYLITNRDNPIAQEVEGQNGDQYVIENASDITFAFNDPNSTSGYLVPSYYIFAQNGVNPEAAFERLTFAGSHEATALAVANNQVDVATNNSESLDRLQETNPEARDQIEVIWESVQIPSDPIAYREDLPEEIKQEIRDFFYGYSDPAVLEPLGWSNFVEAGDADWNPIRELDIGEQILSVQNNQSLSEEEKQTQIEELNKQLEKIKGS
ncbi:MAG: phosphonate ABC transporter substrate-binding protein [Cyanophyceae cyanobacterium]